MVETVNVNPNNKNIYNDIPLTKDESVLMEGLKSMIKKENLTYNKDKIDENYLIRFLRARKLKLDKALDMFKKYLIFRQENSYIENIENTTIPEEADILTYLPQGYHKTDKFDRPIYYELLGRLNLDKLLQITTLDNLFKHRIKVLENMISNILPAASLSAKRNIHQYFSIIDLKGFSSKFLSKKFYEYIKSTLTATQNYYPEILGQMYIVNSNLVFKGAWAIIKPFLDEKTKSKIIFSGKDYKKRLLENVIQKIFYLFIYL